MNLKGTYILIDPFRKTVSTVQAGMESSNNIRLDEIYRLIEADTVDIVRLGRSHHLFVDDVGYLKDTDKQAFFTVWGYTTPLAGKALLCGGYATSKPPGVALEFVQSRVAFLTLKECQLVCPGFPPKLNYISF